MVMRRLWYPAVIAQRGVRQRRSPAAKPVDWLQESATYVDAHTAVVDPFTSSPYPEKVNWFRFDFRFDSEMV